MLKVRSSRQKQPLKFPNRQIQNESKSDSNYTKTIIRSKYILICFERFAMDRSHFGDENALDYVRSRTYIGSITHWRVVASASISPAGNLQWFSPGPTLSKSPKTFGFWVFLNLSRAQLPELMCCRVLCACCSW